MMPKNQYFFSQRNVAILQTFSPGFDARSMVDDKLASLRNRTNLSVHVITPKAKEDYRRQQE
jgi:hypothetical protein